MSAEIQYVLTINTEQFKSDLRKAEISAMRIMSYITRMSGDPNIDRYINKMQKAIAFARTLQLTMTAIAAATPYIGWVYAGVSVATTVFSFADLTEGY